MVSLHRKVVLAVIATLTGLILLLSTLSQSILSDQFAQLEQRQVETKLQQAVNALAREVSDLSSGIADWAHWDDTYEFVQDRNPTYIDLNLTAETFSNLRLNAMLLIDATGAVVFERAYDLQSLAEIPVPPDLYRQVSAHQELVDNQVSGIVLLSEGPMLVASEAILPSLLDEPVRGALIWGRFLDDNEVQLLAETTQLSIEIQSLNNMGVWPDDFQAAYTALSQGTAPSIEPEDETTIIGYGLLQDIADNPALVVRVADSRGIYQQGQTSIAYIRLSLIVTTVVYGLLTMFLLRKLVLSRLSDLTARVRTITETRSFEASVRVEGRDELSSLAASINDMLQTLAQSQAELQAINVELERRVTDRTEKLRLAKEQVEAILNSSSDAIILLQANGLIKGVNPAFRQLFGYGMEELVGQPFTRLLEAASSDQINAVLMRVLADRATTRLEVTAYQKDGQTFDAEMALALIREVQSQEPTIVCSIHDITSHKQLERNLRQALEREAELSDLKTRFVSMVSHEFRTPLAVIQTSSDLLQRYDGRLDASRKAEHLEKIGAQIQHMTGLLEDVLTLGRMDTDGFSVNLQPVALDDLLLEMIAEFDQRPTERHLTYACRGNCRSVVVDSKLIRVIVSNLLTNAVKYSPEGSDIHCQLTCEAESIVFSVRDQGVGIPEKDQERLFESFHRAANVGDTPGTGLGLAITKRAVEALGGTITFESQVGVGTAFTVNLPNQVAHPAH
jgi:PAS domain S-box-containing protein